MSKTSTLNRPMALRSAAGALAAATAIGGTAASIGAVEAAAAPATLDPIFAAIEAHKAAHQTHGATIERYDRAQEAVAKELEATLKAYDANPRAQTELLAVLRQADPRITADQARASIRLLLQEEHGYDASDEALEAASDREAEAGYNLLDVRPTTLAGVVALLRYAVAFVRSGEAFPGGYEIEGEHEMIEEPTFEFMLLGHAADAIENISVA